ncbi:MAG: bifunctional serine/threonine-protein kinase/formylglycine-generating enzyme family protein [Blastocatellia bacterium]
MLRANDQIGPYTLIKQLGKGAFGVVWLAEKRTAIATTQVAIKIALEEEPDLEAIKQEAGLWAQIAGHPNVLPMMEANIYDGQVVIVSEYAPDGSLEGWIKKHGGLAPSVEVAITIATGILSGLEHLHSKKILHRDLKPANILLQGETPRLADFGLSRVLKSTSQSTSASGTPAYMSPEAFDGKKLIATDLWAAGIIIYQLLVGKLPFPAKDYASLIGAIFQKQPEPLPKTLKDFEGVINKALEKNPENRYKTASEMKVALQNSLIKFQLQTKVEVNQTRAEILITKADIPNIEKTNKFIFAPDKQVGPYILIKKLGQGAFGEVWLAEKRTAITTTKVAIKVSIDQQPDLEAIKKEATIWTHISNHPNVLPIIEADIYGENIIIVSEYAPDGSLEDWIKQNGGKAPSIESAVEMTKGVLLGLEHLHLKKVLHRDLKPANILLQGEIPRLADFGLARLLKTTANSGVVAGTPSFMAPEAFEAKRVEQTDIWATGVLLYYLLTGRLPFLGKNINELITAIMLQPPEPLPKRIPKKLQDVIFRALEKEPPKRFSSAKEMVLALQKSLIQETKQTEPQKKEVKTDPFDLSNTYTKPIAPTTKTTTNSSSNEQTTKNNAPPTTPIDDKKQNTNKRNVETKKEDKKEPIKEASPPINSSKQEEKKNSKLETYIVITVGIIILGMLTYDYYLKNIVSTKKSPRSISDVKVFSNEEKKVVDEIKNVDELMGSFVKIPSGEFMMGSNNGQDDEKPIHKVIISNSFEMAATEITQDQWEKVMGNNTSAFRKGGNLPVENVSWDYVQQFIKKVNNSSKKYIYRLPTEAEWEYACRAGSSTDYSGNLDEMAWYGYTKAENKSHLVGTKKPNAWGLYDMHGNVEEWCSDFYSSYPNEILTNPTGPSSGTSHVNRGGGWTSNAEFCRCATRKNNEPYAYSYSLGFRLIRIPR